MTRVKRLATPASVVVALLGAAAALAAGLSLGTPARGLWRRVFYDDFRHGLQPSRWGTYAGEPGGDPEGWWSPSHAVVAHGVLNLETYRDPRYGGRWVSAGRLQRAGAAADRTASTSYAFGWTPAKASRSSPCSGRRATYGRRRLTSPRRR